MNDDTRFDPVDDELRRRFVDTGPSTDPDVVLDSMRPRLQRARTRRRAAFSGAIATVAIAVVAVSFALAGGDTSSVRTPPASHSTVPRPEPPAPSTTPGPVTTTIDDHGGATDTSGGASTPSSAPGGTGSPGSGGAAPAAPTAAPPAAEPQTYTSAGGTITVSLSNGRVSLVSNAAAAGFTPEIHDNGPTRVEVRFNNGQTEYRIRVDVVNGQLQPEIT